MARLALFGILLLCSYGFSQASLRKAHRGPPTSSDDDWNNDWSAENRDRDGYRTTTDEPTDSTTDEYNSAEDSNSFDQFLQPNDRGFHRRTKFTSRSPGRRSEGSEDDVVQKVYDDHEEIKKAYKKIQSLPDGEEADKWLNQLIWNIAKHSAAEEIVVYPLLEKVGPQGRALADKSRADHHKTKVALTDLDGKRVNPDTRAKIDDMMTELLEHIAMEEGSNGDMQMIRDQLPQDELVSAAKWYGRTRMLVPSHPHPSAPDRPPFATVVGLLTAPVDRLRDLLRSFPDETN